MSKSPSFIYLFICWLIQIDFDIHTYLALKADSDFDFCDITAFIKKLKTNKAKDKQTKTF